MRKIRCIVTKGTQKPRERWFILNALKGNIAALEKTYGGTIEVADPSLTEEEAEAIRHNFPYVSGEKSERVNPLMAQEVEAYDPPVSLPIIAPDTFEDGKDIDVVAAPERPASKMEYNQVEPLEVVELTPRERMESVEYVNYDEEGKLRAMLDNAGVKHGRVKKIEKLREMVAELK
jgi:hypothetical protein